MERIADFIRDHMTVGALGASMLTVALEAAYHSALRAASRYMTVRRLVAPKQSPARAASSSSTASQSHETALQDDFSLLGDAGQRVIQRLRTSDANFSAIVYQQGIGVSTLVRGLARAHPAVVYISLADVKNTREITLRFAQTFGIALREQGSIFADMAQRVIVTLRLTSAAGSDDGMSDDDSERATWLRMLGSVHAILADCLQALQKTHSNSSSSGSTAAPPRPVVFLDEIQSLGEEQLEMLLSWAALCVDAHVCIVTSNPVLVLGRWTTSRMLFLDHVGAAPLDAAARFLARRAGLDVPTCTTLCQRIVGTRAVDVVAAGHICREFVLSHPSVAQQLSDHQGPTSASAGAASSAVVGFGGADAASALDGLLQHLAVRMRRDVFAATRAFHLYSCQRLEDPAKDRLRGGIFALSMRLLDTCRHRTAACDVTADDLAGMVIDFRAALAVCPLAVVVPLSTVERSALPFTATFDVYRFKSLGAMHAMAWVVGFAATAARADAETLVALLWNGDA